MKCPKTNSECPYCNVGEEGTFDVCPYEDSTLETIFEMVNEFILQNENKT